MMGRRNVSMIRLGRCVAFLAAAAFLLPFTILLMVADQQYNFTYNSKRVFYQEYVFENGTHDEYLLPKEKFLEVGARMDARREFLQSECRRLGLDDSSHKANAWEYLINRQYHVICPHFCREPSGLGFTLKDVGSRNLRIQEATNLVLNNNNVAELEQYDDHVCGWLQKCNIFKAASTSWMYNFNLMANYSAAFLDKTKDVPLELARKKYARPTVEMIKKAQADSLTFLIVRHPLERLASGYNDKIVHAWPKSFHDKMGQRIIRKYRKSSNSQPTPNERYPVFEEFVSYVLDEARAKRTLDMHWTPYTDFCTPCKVRFDVILKFETLDEDQRFLIQMARLQDIIKPEWRNSGKGTNTLHNINHLYSRLKKSQLDGLYKLYKNDFSLFNYTIDSYYEIVQDDEKNSLG